MIVCIFEHINEGVNELKKERIGIYLPEDLMKEMKLKCVKNKLSYSQYLEKLIRNDLKDEVKLQ